MNRVKRNAVLKKARKLRLTSRDIGLPGMSPISVNEHLCPEFRNYMAREPQEK